MTDWEDKLKAVEAGAERAQAVEQQAEERFRAVHERANAQGAAEAAVESEEFHAWMASRHATDAAWGSWAMMLDAKPVG